MADADTINPGGNANQRVKNVELDTAIKFIGERFAELKADNQKEHEKLRTAIEEGQKVSEERLRQLELWCATSKEKWDQHREEHKNMTVLNSGMELLFAAIAGIFGWKMQ